MGQVDSYRARRPLRYMCHVCLTVYTSQEQLQLNMSHQHQRPPLMLACARCETLQASEQFHHVYDNHYDEWYSGSFALG